MRTGGTRAHERVPARSDGGGPIEPHRTSWRRAHERQRRCIDRKLTTHLLPLWRSPFAPTRRSLGLSRDFSTAYGDALKTSSGPQTSHSCMESTVAWTRVTVGGEELQRVATRGM